MKLVSTLCIACCFTFLGSFTATAQLSSMAAKAPWLQHFFARMSPDTPEFSAVGQFEICDSSGTVQLEVPMDLAATTNAFRWGADASRIWPLPPQAMALAKQMRIDKMVFLIRKNERKVYMIYPNLQAYIELPIPESDTAESDLADNFIQFQNPPLGRESVNGHPCIKSKITDVEPNIPPQTGIVWNATDLQGFPIKMELHASQGLMRFNFQDVVVQSPDPMSLQIPAKYTLFKNSADLMTYAKNQASTRTTE